MLERPVSPARTTNSEFVEYAGGFGGYGHVAPQQRVSESVPSLPIKQEFEPPRLTGHASRTALTELKDIIGSKLDDGEASFRSARPARFNDDTASVARRVSKRSNSERSNVTFGELTYSTEEREYRYEYLRQNVPPDMVSFFIVSSRFLIFSRRAVALC